MEPGVSRRHDVVPSPRRVLHTELCRGKPSRRIRLAALTMAALATVSPLQAQETGTVRGTVTLVENGGPVDGALILIIGTGAFTFTDDGTFEFTNVPAGTYDVIAQREQLAAGLQTVSIGAGETAIADFELSLSPVREEVTVTASAAVGAAATLRTFNAVTTVDSFAIAREAPSTIAEALEDEPGIANRSFGPGASRPVIRGFGGDRVLIIEDGLPTGDLSAASDHHGMTIDPNSAERIEIVRGPATLLYGSGVVGGLINIITPHAAVPEPAHAPRELRRNPDRRYAGATRRRHRKREPASGSVRQPAARARQHAVLGQRRRTPDG